MTDVWMPRDVNRKIASDNLGGQPAHHSSDAAQEHAAFYSLGSQRVKEYHEIL